MIDMAVFAYHRTGDRSYLDHLEQYRKKGINGGAKPWIDGRNWRGTESFVRYSPLL